MAGVAVLALLMTAPAGAGGSELPPPLRAFEAEYRVVNGSLRVATTVLRLEDRPRGWRYRMTTEADGVFALFLDGAIEDDAAFELHEREIRPLRYRHDEPGSEDDVEMDFDWSAAEARVRTHEGRRTLSIEPRTHDPFTVILSVMQHLADGARAVDFPGINDDGEAERLAFEITGRETVNVPFGEFEAQRVRRIRDDKRSTLTWLAPELGWLPVMIEQRRKGELVARMELESLDGREPASDGGQPRGR
jgi:hypothetical protein